MQGVQLGAGLGARSKLRTAAERVGGGSSRTESGVRLAQAEPGQRIARVQAQGSLQQRQGAPRLREGDG